jgi:hypothetical protein
MSGASYYATGVVALDAPDFRNILSRPGGHAEARAIVMHELGHLVGLAHVHDPHELMNERNVGQLDFGPGDLRGLAALGAGPCIGLR